MLHIDLFSGIGGFSYASDQVWSNMDHIFCDIDPFCRAVTQKHWKGAKHYADINDLITDARIKKPRWLPIIPWKKSSTFGNVYLVTGGFPCQPFSQAGRRRGTADDRYLWPSMFRVIQLTHPTWVIAENVRGLVAWNAGMVLEQVCSDLESENYQVQPFIIPACAVNAPHRRDRIWIVAHSWNRGSQDGWSENDGKMDGSIEKRKKTRNISTTFKESSWSDNWIKVATELCGMDDGLPARMDGLELTKAAHRRERLKSLGNAIVPQVAMEIMRAIKNAEE